MSAFANSTFSLLIFGKVLLLVYLFSCFRVCHSIDPDTAGQEFIFCFPRPFHMTSRSGPPTLLITTPRRTTVSFLVTVPGTLFRHAGSITHNEFASVILPFETYLGVKSARYNKTVIVRSPRDVISVYGYHPGTTVSSGFVIIPANNLGRDYYIATFTPYQYTVFTVSAIRKPTNVTIQLANGERSQVALAPYESLQYLSHMDLTGTRVTSDQPVSVVSSATCAQVPPRFGDCGTLTEHLPSVDRLGKRFLVAPFKGRPDGYMFRLIATQNDTTIKPIMSNGTTAPVHLNAGEFQMGDVIGDSVITIQSDKPILVMQYAKGRGFTSGLEAVGNPSMSLIPAVEAYSNNVTFPVPVMDHTSVSITIACRHSAALRLDGIALPEADNITTGTEFCVLRHSVSSGVHTIGHPSQDVQFFVLVYGFGDTGYSYSAGFNLPTRPCFESNVIDRHDVSSSVTKYVQCDDRHMTVYLQRSLINDGNAKHVHANDDEDCCFGTLADSKWVQLVIPYVGCGTIKEDSGDGIVYSNKIIYNLPESHRYHNTISRTPTFDIPVSCHIFDRGLGSLGMNSNRRYSAILNGNKTLGEAAFNLQMYHGKTFNDTYTPEDFPVVVDVGKMIYLEASVRSLRNVTVTLDVCVATPTRTPEKSSNYTFFENGCPVDESVEMLPSAELFRERFSLQAFTFLGESNLVYLHCWMFVCMADDPISRCSHHNCVNKRHVKRDVTTRQSSTRFVEMVVSQGPIIVNWSKERRGHEPIRKAETGSNLPILISAGACLVLFGVICGVAIQFVKQRIYNDNNNNNT